MKKPADMLFHTSQSNLNHQPNSQARVRIEPLRLAEKSCGILGQDFECDFVSLSLLAEVNQIDENFF